MGSIGLLSRQGEAAIAKRIDPPTPLPPGRPKLS
jgi:hypothetical protein